jgi:ribose 5-phosphate isomerase A
MPGCSKAFADNALAVLVSSSGSGLGMLLTSVQALALRPALRRTWQPRSQSSTESTDVRCSPACPSKSCYGSSIGTSTPAKGKSELKTNMTFDEHAKSLQAAPFLRWPTSISNLEAKMLVARRVADMAKDGDVIGVGSGSSAYLALRAIGERARSASLSIRVIPSSLEIEITAIDLGLPLTTLQQSQPTWIVDGADEIDSDARILKGRGGALFREKLLWSASAKRYLVIDATKRVERLGSNFPVPIEVHPRAVGLLSNYLTSRSNIIDFEVRVAAGKDGPVVTETGFLIVDVYTNSIPRGFHKELKSLSGVLETGIFEGYDFTLIEEG